MLQVVWPKPWLADDFETAGVETKRHTGMDVVKQEGPIWWTTEDATLSLLSGNDVCLSSPKGNVLTTLPEWATKRMAMEMTLWDVLNLPNAENLTAFIKSSDSKINISDRQAGIAEVSKVLEWADRCERSGIPHDQPLLISQVVNFSQETRFWYDGETIRTHSIYKQRGSTWDSDWTGEEWLSWEAVSFAIATGNEIGEPCVLDIGKIDNDYALVEVNPVWSSGTYSGNHAAIAECIEASYVWAREGRGTFWEPDVWLRQSQQRRVGH